MIMETADTGIKDIKVSQRPKIQNFVDRQEDYLRKRLEKKGEPVHEKALNAHARDRVAARLKLEKLRKEMGTDPLTRVLNLIGFERALNEEIERLKRTNSKSTIIIMDINDLKKINDTLGHEAGNKFLIDAAVSMTEKDPQVVTGTLTQTSRLTDIISRCGDKSDEFRIILPDTDLEGALVWWERVNNKFNKKGVKLAAGMAILDPDDPKKSLGEADKAMYLSKKLSKSSGENMILRFDQLQAA